MLLNDGGGGGGTYRPPSSRITSPSAPPQAQRAFKDIWEASRPPAQQGGRIPASGSMKPPPGLREFIERKQLQSMLAEGTYVPQGQVGYSDFRKNATPEEIEGWEPLAGHTYTMTQEESDRVRAQIMGQLGETDPTAGWAKYAPFEVQSVPVYKVPTTWEEYDALPIAERNAIDFNTDFIAARDRDFANQSRRNSLTPEQQNEYDTAVRNIFGKDGGSETYAPAVVALLSDIGFTAQGQDLDEYLSLERLINADELKSLDLSRLPSKQQTQATPQYTSVNDPALDRRQYAQVRTPEALKTLDLDMLDKYTSKMEAVMKDAFLFLQDAPSSVASARTLTEVSFGGPGATTTPAAGYPAMIAPGSREATTPFDQLSPDEQLGYFIRQAYEFGMNKENGSPQTIYDWAQDANFTEEDWSALRSYLKNRVEQEKRWGRPADLRGEGLRSPEEIATFFGLED